MKPIGDRILIRVIKQDETTSSGIILTAVRDKKATGKVLAIGNDVTGVKVGDTIQHNPHKGIEVEYDGVNCLLISENNDDVFVL